MKISQYDIWWVDLDPTKGTETQKTRPCVILSNNILNQHGKRVIVAPLLKQHKPWPYVVNIQPSEQNNLDTPRRLDLTQIRSIDKLRLKNHKGILETSYHKQVLRAESAILQ